jgi:hypothetical protein
LQTVQQAKVSRRGRHSGACARSVDKLPPRLIVEYLAERVGPEPATSMVEGALAGERLPLDTRSLLEFAAERLGAGAGRWRLELDVVDGRVGRISRREFVGGLALERFDAVSSVSP